MTETKRYSLEILESNDGALMKECEVGSFVRWEDYCRLSFERDQMLFERNKLRIERNRLRDALQEAKK